MVMTNWPPSRCIVVPIDHSEASYLAAETARQMVSDPAVVKLVYVLEPLSSVAPGVLVGELNDQKRATAVREAVAKELDKRGLTGTQLAIRFGSPGLTICDFAAEVDAELVVLPSHGRSGIKRLLLGSVAETVIRHAHCPVLVLRRSDD